MEMGQIANLLNLGPNRAENLSPQSDDSAESAASEKEGQFAEAMALASQGAPTDAGKPKTNSDAAVKMDLSPQGKDASKTMQSADALATQQALARRANLAVAQPAAANRGVEFQSPVRELEQKQSQLANGTMTEAFSAGPNRPWNSDWVFGDKSPRSKLAEREFAPGPNAGVSAEMEKMQQLLRQLKSQPNTGGEESRISAAALSAKNAVDRDLGGYLEGLNGEMAESTVDGEPGNGNRGSNLGALVGGEAFLHALEASRAGGKGMNGDGGQEGFPPGGQPPSAAALAGRNAKLSGTQPQFQVISGGLSGKSSPLGPVSERGGDEALNGAGVAALGASAQSLLQPTVHKLETPMPMVQGHVVPGSMMRERLTTDTLQNVSTSIRGMSATGGGEMRIRLNPDNLGELMVKVSARGNQVGLQVQATDPKAKKILEESIGSLKDSLANQNLSLAKIEISVNPPNHSHASGDQGSGQSGLLSQGNGWSDSQAGSSAWGNRDGGNGGSRSEWGNDRISTANVGSARAAAFARGNAGASSGRLDVMA